MYDYLIVGAGFSGCVLAERIANVLKKKVLIVEKRNHIGGNAYDYYDESGVLVHKYGPHIFHTNSKKVVDYLSQFTEWRLYEHKVLAHVDGQNVPIPINQNTINKLYGLNLSEKEVQQFFESVRRPIENITNSEEVIIDKVGEDLYNKFFKNYTKKQWDLWPSELDPSVCARIPVRTNRDDRYFSDRYQLMPKYGYTAMFTKMIDNPLINVMLQTDFKDIVNHIKFKKIIYTGPIDAYFNYKFGKLPYRSLRFKFETLDCNLYQEVGTINYPNDYDFTRITEFKHLTGQQIKEKTTIVYEYPASDGEPYYPIPRPENTELYSKYKEEADKLTNIWFVGRLGTYKYYNMDQVVAQALTLFDKIQSIE
jgi:UDP-galactopyranose mutase